MPAVVPSSAVLPPVRTTRVRLLLLAAVVALLAPLALTATATPAQAALPFGARVDVEARKHLGKPYRWGAAGPTRFDCSGFTQYVFARLGKRLPHNSRAQYAAVRPVPRSAKRVGDLIFTRRGGRISHVGIYAGGASLWSPVQTGDRVRKQSFAGRDYVVGRVA